jgi:ROS/MUCR transcriptional regulator protein
MAVSARDPRPVGMLQDGTVFYAPLGEVVDDGQGRVCCYLCGRWLQIVGRTHLRVGHGWTVAQYREAFELLQRSATCSPQLSASYRGYAHARQGHQGFGTTLSGGGRCARCRAGARWHACAPISLANFTRPATRALTPQRSLSPRTASCGGAARPALTSARRRSPTAKAAPAAAQSARCALAYRRARGSSHTGRLR